MFFSWGRGEQKWLGVRGGGGQVEAGLLGSPYEIGPDPRWTQYVPSPKQVKGENPQTGQWGRMKSRYIPSPKHARGEIAIKRLLLPHSIPGFRGRIRFHDRSIDTQLKPAGPIQE